MNDELFDNALRRLVQTTAEIASTVPPTPAGLQLLEAAQKLMDAMDAYRVERQAHGTG